MDDHEGSDDEVTPELRRTSRRRTPAVPSSRRRAMTPDQSKVRRDILKEHAKTYYELEQLVTALGSLLLCGEAEDAVLEYVCYALQHSPLNVPVAPFQLNH